MSQNDVRLSWLYKPPPLLRNQGIRNALIEEGKSVVRWYEGIQGRGVMRRAASCTRGRERLSSFMVLQQEEYFRSPRLLQLLPARTRYP